MTEYTFRNLSPLDFELLSRDLLQYKLSLTLESFKPGKDKGIDFRYLTDTNNTLIVQCKHYVASGFNALYSVLSSSELDKIKALTPKRYILTTSVPLNPDEKDKILNLLSSFILNTGDILGRDDLNNLLTLYPKVEKRFIKLWLSSTAILEELLNASVKTMSISEIETIKRKSQIYVDNPNMKSAIDMLESKNYCIITGAPGVGKTIMAEMILLQYIRSDYEVIKISNDISEGWSLLNASDNRIFYYDDFLGQTSLSPLINKNEDQRIIDFLSAITKSKTSKLIFTTREYILNQAKQQYEKMNRMLIDPVNCSIHIDDYDLEMRTMIFYNHLYYSNIPPEYIASLYHDDDYIKIIKHQNYNPRIIDFFSEFKRVKHLATDEYANHILDNLDNPHEIWQFAFYSHLSNAARNLLLLIPCLMRGNQIKFLAKAFESYHFACSKKYNTPIGPRDFNNALEELDGDFVFSSEWLREIHINLANPSIEDFIVSIYSDSNFDLKLLLDNSEYFEQIEYFWYFSDTEKQKYFRDIILELDADLFNRYISLPCSRDIILMGDHGSPDKYMLWEYPIEKKLKTATDIYNHGASQIEMTLLHNLKLVNEEILNMKADREGLSWLIDILNTTRTKADGQLSVIISKVIKNGIKFLLTLGSSADDILTVSILINDHSELFPPDHLDILSEIMVNHFEYLLDTSNEHSIDTLNEELSTMRELVHDHNFEMSDKINDLENYINENEDPNEEDTSLTPSSFTSPQKDIKFNDDDIRSIFSTLIT